MRRGTVRIFPEDRTNYPALVRNLVRHSLAAGMPPEWTAARLRLVIRDHFQRRDITRLYDPVALEVLETECLGALAAELAAAGEAPCEGT